MVTFNADLKIYKTKSRKVWAMAARLNKDAERNKRTLEIFETFNFKMTDCG
jgi:hypothetical protein